MGCLQVLEQGLRRFAKSCQWRGAQPTGPVTVKGELKAVLVPFPRLGATQARRGPAGAGQRPIGAQSQRAEQPPHTPLLTRGCGQQAHSAGF
jgi:hypothetical protein